MKIGVNSYSFRKLVSTGKMTELEIIPEARRIGFDVIEFSGLDVPKGQTIEYYARTVRDECSRAGIEMGNYTIAADFLDGCGGDLDAEIERVKSHVKVAVILGAKGMRHDATKGFFPNSAKDAMFYNVLPRLTKGCRAVTEYAAELGIRTMTENHRFFCQDSDRMEKLYCSVDHSNFGLLVDIGNFLCADEEPFKAVGKLIPYAFHVHGKDFHCKSGSVPFPGEGWFETRGGNFLRGAIFGHGDLDVMQLLHLVKKSGYDDTISLEFEGIEETILGVTLSYENLKKFIEIA